MSEYGQADFDAESIEDKLMLLARASSLPKDICQYMDDASQEITKLRDEIKEHKQSFDLRWDADQRAIKRWQGENPGNDLTWPDHADLCIWLLGFVEQQHYAARKIGGNYEADGYVVGSFQNRAGAERVVFEFDAIPGMLHIFSLAQVERK